MFRSPPQSRANIKEHQSSYPSGQFFGPAGDDGMALLALSHTPLEDQLYRAMLTEVMRAERKGGAFSIRGLSRLTGINSSSTIRRALTGLLSKLSIESAKQEEGASRLREGNFYQIFMPAEIFERRRAFGLPLYPKEIEAHKRSAGFERALECVARNNNLSRREAQVALACAEGMTNSEIGRRLSIGEQTVKFHLRNIFTKFGVRRRTELISRLLVADNRSRAAQGNQGEE